MDAGWVLDASRPATIHDTDQENKIKRIAFKREAMKRIEIKKAAINRT